ncbi:exo-alpha-sialidase [Treponema phagedenis]|uniref:exo-alpha-sialidase n=1 Tax=Treponema phagedenis TaxID=162 RepID=A0AAE6M7P1_TREPH|nr:sialidase family protein [Treponema phagedenis]NVP24866.1 exo-alpha-sialidase [Treponema phagedenis]QEJ96011.1 hypothetical protein FUT79_12915 [Treponema phagedenis]QEJ98971.1 hypothetical protein FUT82_13880 [Treponema phagedenis]QEK04479.1 hypothetical protein FUT83_12180 [Treponema phagedenis]QEK10134.1 hypothetical protein FUT81_12310 [Treponema phagedenis]
MQYSLEMSKPISLIRDGLPNCKTYRIPILITRLDGQLLFICDARFTHQDDNSNKVSTMARISADCGQSWSDPILFNDFDDVLIPADSAFCNRLQYGIGMSDTAAGKTESGKIITVTTSAPHSTGLCGGATGMKGFAYDNTDGEPRLFLRKPSERLQGLQQNPSAAAIESLCVPEDAEIFDSSVFCYSVPVRGGKIRNDSFPDEDTHTWMNKQGYLFSDEKMKEPLFCAQVRLPLTESENCLPLTGGKTHAHVWMFIAPFQVWRGGNYLSYAESADGKNWAAPLDITYMVKPADELSGSFFVSPTCGLLKQKAPHKGRLLFSAYGGSTANSWGAHFAERVAVFWTDDEAKTWQHSRYIKTPVHKMSESAIIEAPDGALIIFSRSDFQGVMMSQSNDGGATWSEAQPLAGFTATVNNLISVINLERLSELQNKTLVAFSYANGLDRTRSAGTVKIGALVKNGDKWQLDFLWNEGSPLELAVTAADKFFAYSCLAELPDGSLALAYETLDNDDKEDICFVTIRICENS